MKKTIFIIVTRGFIVRNILRSGILDMLIKSDIQIVLFFANVRGVQTGDSLIKEFQSSRVDVHILPKDTDIEEKTIKSKLYVLFKKIAPYLVYSDSTFAYSKLGNDKKLQRLYFWAYVEKFIYTILSYIHVFKKIARWIELCVFTDNLYNNYFDQYKPDLIFSTSVISKHDMQFMKLAKKRGIKTVSMPKGWDNTTKMLYRVVPDVLILQNEVMKQDVVCYQQIPESNIHVCGFPQFDWYRKPEILLSRKQFFERIGMNPNRKLIFFGSEGVWAPQDHEIALSIASEIQKKDFIKDEISLIVRPHFSDISNTRFDILDSFPFVKVDKNITLNPFFLDNWDPSIEETILFINTIYHSDAVIMTASTLALDAACFDKPIIALGYGVIKHPKTKKDISLDLYTTDHFQSVLNTDSVTLVKNDFELFDSINDAIVNPLSKHSQREYLIKKLCYSVDGNSSRRIVDVIFSLL